MNRFIACSICFANADSSLLDAARLGVIIMATVTVGVLGAFARFVVRVSRLAAEPETQAE